MKYMMFSLQPSAEDTARFIRKSERIQENLAAVHTSEEKDSIFSIKMNEYIGTEYDWQLMNDMNPQILAMFATSNVRDILGPITMPDGIHFYRLDGRRSGTNEVVRASHILINFGNNKDSARAVANNIMRQTNTTNFAFTAMEKSEDPGSAPQGGDLGYFSKGRMVPEFERACFNARVGSIVGPIESQFGFHIIYVVDKKSDELKYSNIVCKIDTSNATKKQIMRDAFAASEQIRKGENIDSLATKLGLTCQETP
jgi:hypothetical protein